MPGLYALYVSGFPTPLTRSHSRFFHHKAHFQILIIMPSSNPTVVLVHGGMYNDSYLFPLIASLNARSYPTVTGPLPTVSSPMSKSVDLNSDVDYVRSTLLKPLLDEGKDVVVAMHSYGGIVGGSAVQGLSKTQRTKEGKQGSVLGLVWLVGCSTTHIRRCMHTIRPSWSASSSGSRGSFADCSAL